MDINPRPQRSAGLALAAGGARGAYQAGALRFFADQGIRFEAVAGTSIGALNGAYYAQGDGSAGHMEQLCELWRALSAAGLWQVNGRGLVAALTALLARRSPWLGLVSGLLGTEFAILDPAPIAALLDCWLDYERIRVSTVDLMVAALQSADPITDLVTGWWRKATYFRARELHPSHLRSALLAAVAIPLAFPAQRVAGAGFADAAFADPLPAGILYQNGLQRIVSIFLSDSTVQNRADFDACTLWQIRPSLNIDKGLFSTFDFSRKSIERLLDLGYEDARMICGEVVEKFTWLLALQECGRRNVLLAESLPI